MEIFTGMKTTTSCLHTKIANHLLGLVVPDTKEICDTCNPHSWINCSWQGIAAELSCFQSGASVLKCQLQAKANE
jgi:hypothetical protein